jgi:hypothetical protein
MIFGTSPACAIFAPYSRTWSAEKFGPLLPPRRMTCTSGFPSVSTIELSPSRPTERKTWGALAARHASTAMPTEPSVLFLNPVGMLSALVSSRCT